MNDFQKNRYDSNKLLALFDKAELQEDKGDFFKSFEANDEELAIYFPAKNGVVERKDINRARSLLAQIRALDNLVQDSCKADFEKSDYHVRNFLLYLAYIEIKDNEVSLRYFGERVNTEWDAIFRENNSGNWEKVNF